MIQPFAAQTADGNSTAFDWPGGVGVMIANSTFGSGTVKLQMSPDDPTGTPTNWVDVTSISMTAAGTVRFELPPCKVRCVLSGSTAASLNTWLGRALRTVQ
ncbi:hypothetical protein [Planctomicrobium piriforme]|uniref:Uncharacterized protein n=1 Tax=Planctomicrobium piriforme TaxID=1576369 RepID=A0A1I3ECK7_9PLAN|nr:hypothetical protein [Planctomicrobium piriforme]SFH96573.1 hypothetical protein SAMN05421753_104161 [Planctomicrobium piriforme]